MRTKSWATLFNSSIVRRLGVAAALARQLDELEDLWALGAACRRLQLLDGAGELSLTVCRAMFRAG